MKKAFGFFQKPFLLSDVVNSSCFDICGAALEYLNSLFAAVYIKEINDVLIGTSNDLIRYFMELRGIGIINVKNMYGTGAVLPEKEIELVMDLENWDEGKMYDRLGDGELSEEIFDVKIPKLVIPVHPGRNLAVIIEVAARNHRLKKMGYDAAKELISRTIGQ